LNTYDCKLRPAGGFNCEVAQGKSGDYNSSSECEARCHAPTPPPTPTYNCGFQPSSGFKCQEAVGKSGGFNSSAACQAQCHLPCTNSSANLNADDCIAWQSVVSSSSYFTTAQPPACQELSHLSDPCSCTGVIGCSGGRITSVALGSRGLAFNATDESSLGLLDGLQHIDLGGNGLTGPVPEWLLNLTSLNYV
jgi:hypothetical protein